MKIIYAITGEIQERGGGVRVYNDKCTSDNFGVPVTGRLNYIFLGT